MQNKRCSSHFQEPFFQRGQPPSLRTTLHVTHPGHSPKARSTLLISLATRFRPGCWVQGPGTAWAWLREQGRRRSRGVAPGCQPGLQPACPSAASPAAPEWPGDCSVWPAGGGGITSGPAWTPVLQPLVLQPHPLTCRALGASWLQRIIRVKVVVVTRPPRKCCRHRLSRAAPGRAEVSRAQDSKLLPPVAHPSPLRTVLGARLAPGLSR